MGFRNTIPSLTALGSLAGGVIGRHLDTAFRAIAGGELWTVAPQTLRLLTGEAHPFGNFAVISAPVSTTLVREAVEPLVANDLPSAVIFPDLEVPTDVDAYLSKLGFSAHDSMPAMGVDIASLKPTTLPRGYDLVRVGSGPEREDWVRQFAIGYELPLPVAECFFPQVPGADTSPEANLQYFAVRRHGSIVCTSVCYLDRGVAGIYSVATIPAERRKGLGAHATAEPLRLAARLGYRVGVLQSSEVGYNVYKDLGFTEFGGVPLYVRVTA